MSKQSLLSVKRFSRLLVPDGDEAALAKMMRQVRHWTALDLLRTAGPKSTGTGVSRVYDEDELYKSVILEELVRLGVPAAFLGEIEFGEWLELNKSFDHWNNAKAGERDVFLHFASNGNEGTTLSMSDDPSRLLAFLGFVNVDEALKRNTLAELYSSLIIVNVTALFDRVPK